MEKDYQIKVCIGNYGYYNEGQLRDRWITLPRTDGEIAAFLRDNGLQDPMHEEIYISDYDGIPFGMGYGGAFSELTSLGDLNLLAKQMELAPDWALERVKGAIGCGIDEPESIVELMNMIDQADDIAFAEWPDRDSSLDDDTKLGYALTDELDPVEAMERDELERYFDYKAYGRDLDNKGYTLGDDGYLDSGIADVEGGLYSAEEILEQARSAGWDGVAWTGRDLEDCAAAIEGYGIEADRARPELVTACAYLLDDLGRDERAGLSLFTQHMSVPTSMLDLANAALQADDIYYHEYSYEASDPHERLGRSEVDAVGGLGRLDRDELEGHFDYAAYGRDRTGDFFTGPNGYMLAASLPDFERCSRKELAVDIEARWNEAHGIEASTSEPLQPALSISTERGQSSPAQDEVAARESARAQAAARRPNEARSRN